MTENDQIVKFFQARKEYLLQASFGTNDSPRDISAAMMRIISVTSCIASHTSSQKPLGGLGGITLEPYLQRWASNIAGSSANPVKRHYRIGLLCHQRESNVALSPAYALKMEKYWAWWVSGQNEMPSLIDNQHSSHLWSEGSCTWLSKTRDSLLTSPFSVPSNQFRINAIVHHKKYL